jgi:putative transposase
MSTDQKRALISPVVKLSKRRQCDLLGLPRSSMYYKPYEAPEETNWEKLISEIHAKWPQYGYRKMTVWLKNNGYRINGKKVRRLMKKQGLRSILPSPRTSIPNREHPVYPYLFKDVKITHVNQAWGTDITYIHLPKGTVYLFCLIDWFSRYIVGWKLAVTMEAGHAVEAFEEGLKKGNPEACNADQGSQYTGEKWVTCLIQHGVQISHTGVGRCIDNVYIERFWWTIKYEDIHLKSYETVEEVRRGIGNFITYYNEERPHQALKYKTPHEVYFGRSAQQPLRTPTERRAA